MSRRFFLPVLLVLAILAGALAWHLIHRPHDVRSNVPALHYTLKNGLELLVLPNARVPAVTHILFVKAGGGDDPYGKSGLAHFLEHLMFSGTKNYPEGTYDRTINRLGGQQNAYTTRDFTAYFATVPKDALKQVMAMESDRLQHLEINDAHAKRELQVITEERNTRVDNNAPDLLAEQIDAITFLNHPYGHPLIGWPEDMASFTAADASAFFQRYYRTSNMLLVVAGDVKPQAVEHLAVEYYGALPGGALPARDWPKEPVSHMSRRGAMSDAKAHEPRLLRQYAAPGIRDQGGALVMPLSLVAHYLGGSSTSLLYRRLVLEQKLATEVEVSYDPLTIGPSVLRIWAVPTAGTSLETLEQGLDKALDEALTTPLAADDIARAKTQLKAEVIFAQDGLEPLAHLMGQLIMVGKDERYFYEWTHLVDAVQGPDMLAAAQHVLDPTHAVTGTLMPLAPVPGAPIAAAPPPMPQGELR